MVGCGGLRLSNYMRQRSDVTAVTGEIVGFPSSKSPNMIGVIESLTCGMCSAWTKGQMRSLDRQDPFQFAERHRLV
jgi:hypothetical protein